MGALRVSKSSQETRIDAPQAKVKNSKVTLVLIPGDAGASRRITVSRMTLWGLVFAGFGLIGALAAISYKYIELREVDNKFQALRIEHENIRSEAVALFKQLQNVQSNLSQVDNFSTQVREATQLGENEQQGLTEKAEPSKKKAKKKSIIDSTSLLEKLMPPPSSLTDSLRFSAAAAGGIGPVSEEDYTEFLQSGIGGQNYVVAARVKDDSLAFGEIFDELKVVQDQSYDQINDLSSLLGEVHQYRIRLSKTPTISPVEGRLTSHYGYRNSPISGKRRMHQGLDIAAPLGSPIKAAAAGIVLKVSRAPDYGKYVVIGHGHNVTTLYAHSKKILVKKGEQVTKGQDIALVGMTGRTTGPHLHYEVKVNGQRVNPYSYISDF